MSKSSCSEQADIDLWLWKLQFEILGNGKLSKRYGSFELICTYLHEKKRFPFCPSICFNRALAQEERRIITEVLLIDISDLNSPSGNSMLELRKDENLSQKRLVLEKALEICRNRENSRNAYLTRQDIITARSELNIRTNSFNRAFLTSEQVLNHAEVLKIIDSKNSSDKVTVDDIKQAFADVQDKTQQKQSRIYNWEGMQFRSQPSNLSNIEKLKLERFLQMESDCVINFFNKMFDNCIKNTDIDVYEDNKYTDRGTSKANQLRSFFHQESNHVFGKIIGAMLEYWKSNKETDETFISISPSKQTSYVGQVPAIDTHFEKIQQNIIKHIELARFTIWIAVAWFTDRKIFEKLVVKKNQGVNIQLIIVDDEINGKSGLKYEMFETYRVPKIGEHENIMHNKFCIIDLKKVIHGSYNWTNKAKFNHESITVIENNDKTANEFANQFTQLKTTIISSKL
ncbi:hypothetical protein NIES2101_42500 [Calothrix sp. HK-06]|nr:hypothetical protein NIES2101_42500 [Calothrix sp. HK-06]